MSAEQDPLAAVLADAAALDALASGSCEVTGDSAFDLLISLRGAIDLVAEQVPAGAVALDADLLDLIAAGGAEAGGDPALLLLADLRAAVDKRTAVADAARSRSTELDELAARRRIALPRRLARVAVVAAGIGFAVIGTTGVAAATYNSHPGGTWYSLRTATFGRTDDDPVLDQQLVADIHQQVAAAQATPAAAPAHLAAATAAYARLQKIAPLVHNPVAARQIQASANAVQVSLAHTRLSVHTTRLLAGGQIPLVHIAASRPADGTKPPRAIATFSSGPPVSVTAPAAAPTPYPELTPSVTMSRSSAPSAAPSLTPPPPTSAASEPAPSESQPDDSSGSPTPSGTVSSSPSTAPSPAGSTAATPSASTTPPAASTVPTPTRSGSNPTLKSAPVKVTKKTAKRKKVVTTTATLMSATVPATDASLRPNH